MKKLAILLAFVFLFAVLKAQTIVHGGIYSNTTWTPAGSPYIIEDSVVVFQNINLTIQPGVVVKFDTSALLIVEGSILANGTANDSIIFTSDSSNPYPGIYKGINDEGGDTIAFRYCRFSFGNNGIVGSTTFTIVHCKFTFCVTGIAEGAYKITVDSCMFTNNYDGIFGGSGNSGPVYWCEFRNNSNAGIDCVGNGADSIINCVFVSNNVGAYCGFASNCLIDSNANTGIFILGSEISHCIMKYNGTAISSSYAGIHYNDISDNAVGIFSSVSNISMNNISNNNVGIKTSYDTIMCNSICNNSSYNVVSEMSTNELINGNYWCLPDSAHIQATIYDAYQNISLGFIYFTPFDTVACSNVSTGLTNATADEQEIEVYPNPGNGKFTVESSVATGPLLVEVYNVLGEKILTANFKSGIENPIDLSQKPSGVYFIRGISKTGQLEGEAKVIKQ